MFAPGDHSALGRSAPATDPEFDNGPMAGKEIDPQRAQAARDVVRQHPGMVLAAVSPVLIAAGLVWWLVSPGWAIVLLVAALVAGGWSVVRKR